MPSSLPTTDSTEKSVNTFGIGTYDSLSDSDGNHGENSERQEPSGKSLPNDGGPEVFGPDRLLSYPESPGSHVSSWHQIIFAAANVPGELDRENGHEHPNMSTIDSRIQTVSQDVPTDSGNPSAHSDYYDKTVTGGQDDMWPKEDSGAYVSQEKTSESALPGVLKNEETMDNTLQSLGNWQSGYEIEDISKPNGFPSTDFSQSTDFDRSDLQDGGRIVSSIKRNPMNRTATNIKLVNELTSEFIKEFGKKDLTKRHVLAFLQKRGEPQFLSSDIIRCMKLSHKIYVKDVLDEFPVAKKASGSTIASVRDRLIQLEIDHITDPKVSSVFRRCAADLAKAIAVLERVEARNG